MLHTIFFDLDNTLYSRKSGIWEAIGSRINLFMKNVLRIPNADVMPMRIHYRKNFGTTLMGLKSMFEVDEMEYLEFVHDINLDAMLIDDGRLHTMLKTIPQRKIIFTNSDARHAKRVLEFFGIREMFDLIIDVIALKPHVKPQPEAYQKALGFSGFHSAEGCMFIDDMIENVAQGNQAGFISVFVGDGQIEYPSITDILQLPELLKTLQLNDAN